MPPPTATRGAPSAGTAPVNVSLSAPVADPNGKLNEPLAPCVVTAYDGVSP